MPILEVKNLKKIYTSRFGSNSVQALSNVSFSVEKGEYVAIMGESAADKTRCDGHHRRRRKDDAFEYPRFAR